MSIPAVLSGEERWHVEHGSCVDILRALPDNSLDSCVTDPPYGLRFMARSWDRNTPDGNVWQELLRVLKPGAHIVVFGGTRTYHRVACAIEDAGFELRDSIADYGWRIANLEWLYGSGFPKSLNISKALDAADGLSGQRQIVSSYTASGNAGASTADKGGTYAVGAPNSAPVDLHRTAGATDKSRAWDGFGTALKPAHEPIILARKPLDGTVANNVTTWGTGGLNIDGCRVSTDWSDRPDSWKRSGNSAQPDAEKIAAPPGQGIDCHPGGRWPPNVVFTHHPDCGEACASECHVMRLGEQSGESVSVDGGFSGSNANPMSWGEANASRSRVAPADSGTAARYFPQFRLGELDLPFLYCAKAGRRERDAGLEHIRPVSAGEATGRVDGSAGLTPRAGAGRTGGARNTHPTVKPIELMRWLCRLITPPGGVTIDIFTGSGSTGVAAVLEGFRFVGCELNDSEGEPFVSIARARIEHVIGSGSKPVKPAFKAELKQGVLFG